MGKCYEDLNFLNEVAFNMFGPLLVKPGVLVQLTRPQMLKINAVIDATRRS